MAGVTLTWSGGEHSFRIDLGGLRALQDQCAAAPPTVYERLRLGGWFVDDVLCPLRLGLQGGGMSKDDARDTVLRLEAAHGLMDLSRTALLVLGSSLLREEEDPVGEHQGVSPTPESGVSASSTVPGPVPGSPPET